LGYLLIAALSAANAKLVILDRAGLVYLLSVRFSSADGTHPAAASLGRPSLRLRRKRGLRDPRECVSLWISWKTQYLDNKVINNFSGGKWITLDQVLW